MLLLRTPDKIFLKLGIDNINVEKQNRYYLDNAAIQSLRLLGLEYQDILCASCKAYC
jgi:hypothetical protein